MENKTIQNAGSVTVEFGGDVLIIPDLNRADAAACEQHYLSLRPNILQEAMRANIEAFATADEIADGIIADAQADAKSLPADEAEHLIARAQDRADRLLGFVRATSETVREHAMNQLSRCHQYTSEELIEWLESPAGEAYSFQVILERAYPGRFTAAEALEVMEAYIQQRK